MSDLVLLDKVRCGGRNYIRPGDLVKFSPAPGRRKSKATVRRLIQRDGYVEVEIAVGAPRLPGDARPPRPIRSVRLDRIERTTATS